MTTNLVFTKNGISETVFTKNGISDTVSTKNGISDIVFTKNGIPYNKYSIKRLESDYLILITGSYVSHRNNLALHLIESQVLDHKNSILVTTDGNLRTMLPLVNHTATLEYDATVNSVLEDEASFILIDSFKKEDHFEWMNSYKFDLFKCASNLRIITANKVSDLPEELWKSVDLVFALETDIYVEVRRLYNVYFSNYPHYHTFYDDFRDIVREHKCIVKDDRNHKIYYYEADAVTEPITNQGYEIVEELDLTDVIVQI